MGNAFRRSNKKENEYHSSRKDECYSVREYMTKIKDFDVDSDEISNELPINNIVLVKCLKEIIAEIQELQEQDRRRLHMLAPKLDFCSMSII